MKKKDKLPYSEELADAIIAEHRLRPEVKKGWKFRGSIPGHYLDESRDETRRLSDSDPEYQKFKSILARPEIANTKFRCLGKKGQDVKVGKDRMTEAERIGLKTEITELRNKIRMAKDAPTPRNLLQALTDARLHPTKIVGPALYDRIRRQMELHQWEKSDAQVALLALYNILKI